MSLPDGAHSRRDFLGKGALSVMSLLTMRIPEQEPAAGIRDSNRLVDSAKTQAALQTIKTQSSVPTILKSLSPTQLGTTLMHEHVLFGTIPPALEKRSIDIAVKMLNEAKAAGVDTIVDLTPYRNIRLYQKIAEQTRINIIASTGYYSREKMPEYLQNMSELQMENRMYKEVTQGIDGTTIKAGIIKIAADHQALSDWEKQVFRAAARVQKSTKIPIATHAWTGARAQFELLTQSGVDMKHVNFGHIETTGGWNGKTREQMAEEFLPIVQSGGYLLFNNFSCEFYTPWKDLVYLIKFYSDKGFADQILISEDCNWEWKNGQQVFEKQEEFPDAAKRVYAYMMKHEVPLMYESGFSEKEIHTFMVDNPRRFFS